MKQPHQQTIMGTYCERGNAFKMTQRKFITYIYIYQYYKLYMYVVEELVIPVIYAITVKHQISSLTTRSVWEIQIEIDTRWYKGCNSTNPHLPLALHGTCAAPLSWIPPQIAASPRQVFITSQNLAKNYPFSSLEERLVLEDRMDDLRHRISSRF